VRKRWFALALVALVVAFAIIGAAVRGSEASAKRQALGACLVTDIGGLNDKSFNHLAYVGLQRAQKQLGITGRVIQSKSPADYIPNLSTCVRQGSAVTIGVGFLMTDAMDAVSSKFPRNKFAIVDVNVEDLKHKGKNVQGLLFKEQEAGYLVGVAAGLWAKGHPLNGGPAVVGSVGGIKIPPVDRYIAGYQYGAKQADPQVKVLNDYSQDFVAQAKCKEKALNEIANGAAVVFQVAGQCGLGVLDAAKEKKVFGIGVDADQGYLGTQVMTSALKRVDVAVFKAIQATKGGSLKTGINAIFGAKENGIGVGKFSPQVSPSIKKTVANKLVLLKQGKVPGIPTTVK
jgi:basic membrane protein A